MASESNRPLEREPTDCLCAETGHFFAKVVQQEAPVGTTGIYTRDAGTEDVHVHSVRGHVKQLNNATSCLQLFSLVAKTQVQTRYPNPDRHGKYQIEMTEKRLALEEGRLEK